MSNNMYWLIRKLNGKIEYKTINEQMIEFDHWGEKKVLYCPFTDEYDINSELIFKVSGKGVNLIVYPTSWCRATREAIEYGTTLGIEVIPLSRFLSKYVDCAI